MTRMKALLAALVLFAAPALAQSLDGLWDGTVKVNNDFVVPFRFELSGSGANVKGSFFNGDEKFTSTSGRLENNSLVLSWAYYASKLEATANGGVIEGTYSRARNAPVPFRAVRAAAGSAAKGEIPQIGGVWEIHGLASEKKEKAWQLVIDQSGAKVSAGILRVDGDTGTLTGAYRDGKFVVSHFSGSRPSVVEITAAGDGTLKLALNGKGGMTAVRPAVARAQGLPEPDDPGKHTGVKDPAAGFPFQFPDLNGRVVSSGDARFQGKVVLVNITGSWCPNCHDEAPFLVQVYRKYRSQGLEIVGLSFEEADQLKDPVRMRSFIKRYGIEYTMLLCGTTDEATEKLSQAVNFDAWPTTFFVGRDGRVRAVHSGFPSKASGELLTKAKEEFTETVERLLAENKVSSR